MTSQVTGTVKKSPGQPDTCPENNCRECETLEECRRVARARRQGTDISAAEAEARRTSLGSLLYEDGDIASS